MLTALAASEAASVRDRQRKCRRLWEGLRAVLPEGVGRWVVGQHPEGVGSCPYRAWAAAGRLRGSAPSAVGAAWRWAGPSSRTVAAAPWRGPGYANPSA